MPVIKQDPKINFSGANVIELTSIQNLPADTPDGTIIVVPKADESSDRKYLYNGFELPDINEVWTDELKAQYPYAIIGYVGDELIKCNLLILPSITYTTLNGDKRAIEIYPGMSSYCLSTGGGFRPFSSSSENTQAFSIESIDWASFDILNEDGSVSLPASDPVPVGGETATTTNADLYVKKNGKVYKTTSGGAAYGTSGIAVLTAGSWRDGYYTLTVADLGNQDAIFFTPSTRDDKTALEDADVFILSTGQTVIFEAAVTPTTNITLFYFITRGA